MPDFPSWAGTVIGAGVTIGLGAPSCYYSVKAYKASKMRDSVSEAFSDLSQTQHIHFG